MGGDTKHLVLIVVVLVALTATAAACGDSVSQSGYGSLPDTSSYDFDTGSNDTGRPELTESEARLCRSGLDFAPNVTPATELAAQMPKGMKPAFSTADDGALVWTYTFDDGSRLKVTFTIHDTRGNGQELRVRGVKVRAPQNPDEPSSGSVDDGGGLDSGDWGLSDGGVPAVGGEGDSIVGNWTCDEGSHGVSHLQITAGDEDGSFEVVCSYWTDEWAEGTYSYTVWRVGAGEYEEADSSLPGQDISIVGDTLVETSWATENVNSDSSYSRDY